MNNDKEQIRPQDKEKPRRTTISISYENYLALKKFGGAGDSFNDVITELIQKGGPRVDQ